jgi:PBSX family phage portal protein
MTSEKNTSTQSATHMFEFGAPEPVLNNHISEYLGVYLDTMGEYYRPPVSLSGLADIMNANPHHNSILHFKKNMVLKWFIPSTVMTYATMQRLALDYVVTGMLYFQVFRNGFGKVVRTEWLPSLTMRRGRKKGVFFKLNKDGSKTEFKPGEVIQINNPDLKQDIYGLPEYLGGIQSVLLSEEAGLFRRKYYSNGAHMGYILVTNDADLDEETALKIQKKVQSSKGPGNFRSLYLNIGKSAARDPVQIIPVGDIGTKDEFERIKNITMIEILSMHRMQPGLSGIMPDNTGGFGDIEKIMRVYHELEIGALQQPFLEINQHIGAGAVSFKEPMWRDEQKA